MRFQSFLTEVDTSVEAIEELIDRARDADVGETDLAFVFFTAEHRDDAAEIVERVWLELDPQCVIGCSAEGVIGADREVERSPGLSLLVGQIADARVRPFHIPADQWHQMLNDPEALAERLGVGELTRGIIGFGDPWTCPIDQFMKALDRHAPQAPLIGGMASSARAAGGNVLVRNDEIYDEGFVGLTLAGPIDVQTIVSQGCRPIGQTFVITKAHENVIEQLGGKPALVVLRDVVNSVPETDQALLQRGVFIGRAVSEYREKFGRGDFLVRNLIGASEESGAIALADLVRVGQTVQFHVRDAHTADEDLKFMLDAAYMDKSRPAPAAGLLFSCNGRGTRLFDAPSHDIAAARRAFPPTPFAGFFAAGEIGRVGKRNFLHGHTASIALLRPGS